MAKNKSKIIAGFTTKNDGFSLSHYKSQNLGLHVGDDRDTVVKNRNQLAESIQFPYLNGFVYNRRTETTSNM